MAKTKTPPPARGGLVAKASSLAQATRKGHAANHVPNGLLAPKRIELGSYSLG